MEWHCDQIKSKPDIGNMNEMNYGLKKWMRWTWFKGTEWDRLLSKGNEWDGQWFEGNEW